MCFAVFTAFLYYFLHIRYIPYKPGYAEADRQTYDHRQAELHPRRHLQAGQRQHQENDDRHMEDIHSEGMLREEPAELLPAIEETAEEKEILFNEKSL